MENFYIVAEAKIQEGLKKKQGEKEEKEEGEENLQNEIELEKNFVKFLKSKREFGKSEIC